MGKDDLENKDLREVFSGFDKRLGDIEEKMEKIENNNEPIEISTKGFSMDALPKVAEYLKKQIGRQFTERGFSYAMRLLGGETTKEGEEIKYVLPMGTGSSGESFGISGDVEEKALHFIYGGLEHQLSEPFTGSYKRHEKEFREIRKGKR